MTTASSVTTIRMALEPQGPAALFGAVLAEHEKQELLRASTLREYAPHVPIFHEGDEAEHVALLLCGEAKLTKIGSQGKECVLCLVKEGRLIDPAALYYSTGYPATASAVHACTVLLIPCWLMKQFIAQNSAVADVFLKALAARQRLFINKTAESQGLISVSRRVASWILHRSKMEQSQTIDLLSTRELLARLLGVSRESLSRELNALARAGVIVLERRRITICDRQALYAAAHD